jgi:hypothetical protein
MSGTASSAASSATGQFRINNGQIVSPSGNTFTAEGINVYDSQMGDASQILTDFPGIDFVRLNVYSYQSPSAYASFINTMTSAGVVVELEDHTNSTGANSGAGAGTAFSGSQLTNELNWYRSMASAYASNPYVWFGTDNEPPAAGLSSWEQQTYNAIRDTGNNNPIVMELPGGGIPGQNAASYGMNPAVYASMSNIVWDVHNYGWDSNYSTNQQDVNSALTNLVQQAQAITSANGTVPVIVGEYGPSTNGQSTDPNSNQVLQAVQQAAQSGETAGAVAWGWDPGTNDNLTNGQGSLTSYGQEVAQSIASTQGNTNQANAASAASDSSAAAPASAAPSSAGQTSSPNDTMVLAGSSGTITDASGNQWTITGSGQVAVNGTADPTTANVTELAYVNNQVWQENSSNLWWSKTSPTAAWSSGYGTSTSPLPAPISIASGSASETISQSQVSVAATSGNQMLFMSGSGDIVTLTGGADTISDTGSANTYILPAAGQGTDTFTSDILSSGDTLDLMPALAATNWNGASSTLSNYLSVADQGNAAVLSIAPTSGGAGTAIATITGASGTNLSTLLAHSIT